MERRHECRLLRMPVKAFLLGALFIGQFQVGTSQHVGGGARLVASGEYSSPKLRSLKHEGGAHLVDSLYTFGSPSTIASPHSSNPGNKCIPGIRTFTEDVASGQDCEWWQVWCSSNDRITNTDFAAQLNVDDYPHPKISTLVLRYRDDAVVEYVYEECDDYEDVEKYDFQSWPGKDQPAGILPGYNIHDLDEHYERRIMEVPSYIRGPLLDYISVSMCGAKTSYRALVYCFDRYGLSPEWTPFAYMKHLTDFGSFGDDPDVVFVAKNDDDQNNHRRCIISFAASGNFLGDHWKFLFENSRQTGYCGRYGIHAGVSDELWHITHNDKYSTIIKPALETCHEVTCVGFSLGGALCDIFTMCANKGESNLDGEDGEEMYDDYNSLAWTKAVFNGEENFLLGEVNANGAGDDDAYNDDETWRI